MSAMPSAISSRRRRTAAAAEIGIIMESQKEAAARVISAESRDILRGTVRKRRRRRAMQSEAEVVEGVAAEDAGEVVIETEGVAEAREVAVAVVIVIAVEGEVEDVAEGDVNAMVTTDTAMDIAIRRPIWCALCDIRLLGLLTMP